MASAVLKGVKPCKECLFWFRINTQKALCPQETCTVVCVTKQLRLLLTHILAHLGIFRFSEVYSWANPTQMANRTRQSVASIPISLRRLCRKKLTCF
jgi:hypothetical protein